MNIYYTNGFNTDKKIGQAHNDFAELAPEDSWLIFQDQDVCFLTPNTGRLIHDAIKRFGNDYDIMGVLTNRIGVNHQLYNGLSYNYDMMYHSDIARQLEKQECYIKECDLVAGFMMIMTKFTWKDCGGFKPGIHFDSMFCKEAKDMGHKLGILQNIYVYHHYRPGVENPSFNYHHLL